MIKLIACDLGGTLIENRQPVSKTMAALFCELLEEYKMAIISGAPFEQFLNLLIDHLPCSNKAYLLENLYLLPENGSSLYVYDNGWKSKYQEILPDTLKRQIAAAFKEVAAATPEIPKEVFGDQIQDRGGQMTFSALGKDAPADAKRAWDPDISIRRRMVQELLKLLPDCLVSIGGMTSIDVTLGTSDKSSAIQKLREYTGLLKEEIMYFGDSFFPGGNDEPIERMGVKSVRVQSPHDTEREFHILLSKRLV